jgi:rod shape-determining protein MreB
MAAAIGADLPVSATGSRRRRGDGTMKSAYFAGRMVYAGSVRVGGDKSTGDRQLHSASYGMLISETTAEHTADDRIGVSRIQGEGDEVKGRNLAEHPRASPCRQRDSSADRSAGGIVSAVKSALERTPPELGADIAEHGMVLTGGARCCATSTSC